MIETVKNLPTFDVFVILFLFYCIFMGGKRGIFLQITSIVSLLAGWYVSSRYSVNFKSYFPLGDALSGKAASIATFFAVEIGVLILGKVLSGMLVGGILKEANRQLGALFGLVKGLIVCLVVTYFAVTLSSTSKKFVIGSQSGRMMIQLLCEIQKIIPDNAQTAKVKSALDDFHKAAGDGNAVKRTSTNYQISTFKEDIANSFQKAKEKANTLKKTIGELDSLTKSFNGFQKNLSFGDSYDNYSQEPDYFDPTRSGDSAKNYVEHEQSVTRFSDSEVSTAESSAQDDIFQKADDIFSRSLFRTVSPVDESDRQNRISNSKDIYGSGVSSSSDRYYTPSY
ncbi:MAG: CvpA family protein [Thermoguttaceae bacterium]|nr:CvpA family protein [Thermoguttaceae bacterium]